MALITTIEEYYKERYEPLEKELLESVSARMGREYQRIKDQCLTHWEESLKVAREVQEEEKIPCGYMSTSLLNTSLLEGNPCFQVDFYNRDWVYGEPWARYRMTAEFLFREWEDFYGKALDENYYVRGRLQRVAIKSLFWGTAEKILYLFAGFGKYFFPEMADSSSFRALEKEPAMYVTCGTYWDWQERIYAILPEIDLTDPPLNEETAFREFRGKTYRDKIFEGMDLRHCRFYDCLFRNCQWKEIQLSDALFHQCRFYDTKFTETKFPGCSWRGCSFVSSQFLQSGTQAEGEEYFAEAEMIGCKLRNLQVVNGDFSHFSLEDCDVKNLSMEDTKLESSAWKVYAGGNNDG